MTNSSGAIILPWQDCWPQISAGAFVAPGASLVGRVTLAPGSSVWFGCVLRGDERAIRVGEGSNIQDLTVIHTSRGGWDAEIGKDVTVGHRAVLHGCRLEDACFVGIGAVLMDAVVVESGAMVVSGALVTPGKRVPGGEVWAGSPAKKLCDISPEQLEMIRSTAPHYRAKAADYLQTAQGTS